MKNRIDLTTGDITKTLIRLASPIMATSMIQMLYNITDQLWLGRFSTEAVAGSGVVGFLLWGGASLSMISSVGTGVNLARSVGEKDYDKAGKYVSSSIFLSGATGLFFIGLCLISIEYFLNAFNLKSSDAYFHAKEYFNYVMFGEIFQFFNILFASIFNSYGKSSLPFKITSLGLVVNMVLDPLLIFTFGMGTKGAAIATVVAKLVVFGLFLMVCRKEERLFAGLSLPEFKFLKDIVKIGLPTAMHSLLFALVNTTLSQMMSRWGPKPIAAQSIGTQIESISWMSAEGFSTAITAFVAQNHGAGDKDRMVGGYKSGLKILMPVGFISMILLFTFGNEIFAIFTPKDPEAIAFGARYLYITAFSQAFMTLEGASAGFINGVGKTYISSANGISLNLLRIPLAAFLIRTGLGHEGIWWAMCLSSILKGTVMFLFSLREVRKVRA
ncbi:MAG: MATE family efflux transporter [Tissierellia bacterium]|nr:MATE family efflux transporter [Tissierellia bacterium]